MTENEPKIAIFVPDAEARLFIEFKRHQNLFTLLMAKGVFSHKNAAITLHFDQTGQLAAIDKVEHLWNARREKKLPTPQDSVQKDALVP